MKKFFTEFKKFITRGNVLDMAVGVIVGGAFTAIVNGLSNNVLKPIINWVLAMIIGKDGLSGAITPLSMSYKLDETTGERLKDEAGEYIYDLANSIYIDWGAFISAIINFLLIALVLFCIVRFINKLKDGPVVKPGKISKEDKKAMKAKGIKLKDKEAVDAYFAEKAEADAKAKAEREANPTTEDLLKKILVALESK